MLPHPSTLLGITRMRSRRLLGVCYIVVKVSLLVVVEIGVFPLICGWWLDICSLEMFDATLKDRELSFQSAPGTTMFLHWLVGMVYVFYFASFILLLREGRYCTDLPEVESDFCWEVLLLLLVLLVCSSLRDIPHSPVFAGRWLMSFWTGTAKIHELYTAACGLYVCWLTIRAVTVLVAWMPQGRRVIFQKVKEWSLMIMKTLIVAVLLAGVVPLLLGLLFELVIVAPLRVPLDQTPLFYPWQVYANGIRNIDLHYIIRRLAAPVISVLLLSLCVPYVIASGVVPLLGVTAEMQNLVHRRIYPFLLMVVVLMGILSFQVRQFKRLYEHIKNDKPYQGRKRKQVEVSSGVSVVHTPWAALHGVLSPFLNICLCQYISSYPIKNFGCIVFHCAAHLDSSQPSPGLRRAMPLPDTMFCAQQIHIPPELPDILKQFTKAAIRTQPADVLQWSAGYFSALSRGDPLPVKDRIEMPVATQKTDTGLTQGLLKVLHKQSLTTAMKHLCEILTSDPEGGAACIPFETFSYVYRYLSGLDSDIPASDTETYLASLKENVRLCSSEPRLRQKGSGSFWAPRCGSVVLDKAGPQEG
ncbi:hypothetical protein CB1_064113044 [Camelus ferus]|nr:hypothetical protein CB1_064113044 [Camelus ferus]